MQNRIIKFRAWDKTKNKMLDWNYIEDYCGVGYILDNERIIPMQYTGLKDKNGKEIYEGDVVRGCLKGVGMRDLVVKYNTSQGFYPLQSNFFGIEDSYEVIGNIYENPELIK